MADPRLNVRGEKDRCELRLVHLGEGRRQGVEDGGGQARSPPPERILQDRLALALVRALVDDRLTLAVTVMDRPGQAGATPGAVRPA